MVIVSADCAGSGQRELSRPASRRSSLGHKPGSRWTFDAEVAACFDDMLRRSIPQHDAMREICAELAIRYARPRSDIVDLGCSRGGAIAGLINRVPRSCRFTGIEVSPPMLTAARERFARIPAVRILDLDLRTTYPDVRASVTMAVLTVQFTPIEHRQRILSDIHRTTLPGGALILVEKVLGKSADLDRAMVDVYYAYKRRMGYTQEEIDRKRLSLEGVLVPVTAEWNEDLLRTAGFRRVDCVWRWSNFAAWLALKA